MQLSSDPELRQSRRNPEHGAESKSRNRVPRTIAWAVPPSAISCHFVVSFLWRQSNQNQNTRTNILFFKAILKNGTSFAKVTAT
jgi:hypothetical protein